MRIDLKYRIGMSRQGDCNEIQNYYKAPYRFMIEPFIVQTQLNHLAPNCLFPANFSGTWYTTGEYDIHVLINQTHIYYKLQIDQFHWQETFFTCQQQRESRYLTMAITNGKWYALLFGPFYTFLFTSLLSLVFSCGYLFETLLLIA